MTWARAHTQNSDVVNAIGAQSTYSECPTSPYAKMVATGDEARSFLPALESVVQSGVNVLIWAGDLGMHAVAPLHLQYPPWRGLSLSLSQMT